MAGAGPAVQRDERRRAAADSQIPVDPVPGPIAVEIREPLARWHGASLSDGFARGFDERAARVVDTLQPRPSRGRSKICRVSANSGCVGRPSLRDEPLSPYSSSVTAR